MHAQTQAGQNLGGGGGSTLQQLPSSLSSSSSSSVALSAASATPSAASDPCYDAVSPEDLERAKKAAAGGSSAGSSYCSLPGVAATTVYYREKCLVVVRNMMATGTPEFYRHELYSSFYYLQPKEAFITLLCFVLTFACYQL